MTPSFPPPSSHRPPFELKTDALDPGTGIFDARYTCDSDNSSPEVRWSEPPEGTTTLALVMDDPDAPQGLFIHWVVYGIPPSVRHLPAGIPPQESLPNGIRQGLNSARKLGYFGPCPPAGDAPHRYRLTLYALHTPIELDSRMTGEELRRRMEGRILARAETTGRYGRARQAG